LVDLGFDVISAKQISATLQSPAKGWSTVHFPVLFIISSRTSKSQEIFKLTSLCGITSRVDAYKAHTGLTHCYNCQKFGHVWANCKEPPHFMWYGGDHLHKECPE
jgi:hypothetical protein